MARTNRNLLAVLLIVIFVNLVVIGILVLRESVLFAPPRVEPSIFTPQNNIVLSLVTIPSIGMGGINPFAVIEGKLDTLGYDIRDYDSTSFLSNPSVFFKDLREARTILLYTYSAAFGADDSFRLACFRDIEFGIRCCEKVKELAEAISSVPYNLLDCNQPPENDRYCSETGNPDVAAICGTKGPCRDGDGRMNSCVIFPPPNVLENKDVIITTHTDSFRMTSPDVVTFGPLFLDSPNLEADKVLYKVASYDSKILANDIAGRSRRYVLCSENPSPTYPGCRFDDYSMRYMRGRKDLIFGKDFLNFHTVEDSIEERESHSNAVKWTVFAYWNFIKKFGGSLCKPDYRYHELVTGILKYCGAVINEEEESGKVEFVPTVDSINYVGNNPAPLNEVSTLQIGFSSAVRDGAVEITPRQCPPRIEGQKIKEGNLVDSKTVEIRLRQYNLMAKEQWDDINFIRKYGIDEQKNWPYYLEVILSNFEAAPMNPGEVQFAGNTAGDSEKWLWPIKDADGQYWIKETWENTVGKTQGPLTVKVPCVPELVCKKPYIEQHCADAESYIIAQDGWTCESANSIATMPPDPRNPVLGLGCYDYARDLDPYIQGEIIVNGCPGPNCEIFPGEIIEWASCCENAPPGTPGCYGNDDLPIYPYYIPHACGDGGRTTITGYKKWPLDSSEEPVYEISADDECNLIECEGDPHG